MSSSDDGGTDLLDEFSSASESTLDEISGYVGGLSKLDVRRIARDVFYGMIIGAILTFGKLLVMVVQTIFLGLGQRYNPSNPAELGIAEIPVYVAIKTVGAFAPTATSILDGFETFNQAVADLAGTAGLAGPPVVAALYVVEIIAVSWVAWLILDTFQLGDIIRRLAEPPVKLIKRLR